MQTIIMRWDDKQVDAHIIDGAVEPTIQVYNPDTDETDSFVEYLGNEYTIVFQNTDKDLVRNAYNALTSLYVV